jgi:hypothetical protein
MALHDQVGGCHGEAHGHKEVVRMLRTTIEGTSIVPLPLLRVLIEDPLLAGEDLPVPRAPVEVTVCSGPCAIDETCPLVMDGSCPHGPFDVVVSALGGPWARSVCAAWGQTPTPVVDASDVRDTDPTQRLAHHLGVAFQQLTL